MRQGILGPWAEFHRTIEAQHCAKNPSDSLIHGHFDVQGKCTGIFRHGTLHGNPPGGSFGIARIEEPGPVAVKYRDRGVKNVSHHLVQIACPLNRPVDPIQAFEEMDMSQPYSFGSFAVGYVSCYPKDRRLVFILNQFACINYLNSIASPVYKSIFVWLNLLPSRMSGKIFL